MDHKELFDEVINETHQDAAEAVDDNIDNCIQLKLSTGEMYLVDANTFDWDNAVKNLTSMIENEDALRSIMFALLNVEDPSEAKATEMINDTIKQLETFMDNFQVHANYEQFDSNITSYKKALFMVFDANNIVRTMSHHTEMYNMIHQISMITDDLEHNICDCPECDHEHDDHPYQIFKVTAVTTEGGTTIDSIEPGFCSPDEIDIIMEYDGKMVVHVCSKDFTEAREDALAIFGCVHNTPTDIDDRTESGLLID